MKHLHTEIQIEADPAEVWAVLMDFDRYPDWNPFLVDVRGDAQPGERLRVTLSPPGGRRITMRPTVTELVPGRVFEWWGHLASAASSTAGTGSSWTFSGTGTRFVQQETFTGLLVPLLSKSLDGPTAAGFTLMNERRADPRCGHDAELRD